MTLPPELTARIKAKNLLGGIDLETDRQCDNLAVALASYFSRHMYRPNDDEDDPELGWGKWVMTKTEEALDLIVKGFAEPLHKEIEELRNENKAARSAENEWRETIQELRKEREFFEANSVYYQRQSDALEAQLAEAKDQITSLQYELAAANHQP